MNRRTAILPAALSAILIVGATSACTWEVYTGQDEATGDEVSETRPITEVTRVELRTTGTLNLAVGDEAALSVTGKEDVLSELETTVEGDTLVIDLHGSWRDTGFLEYNLVLPELSTVVLGGSGQVFGGLGGTDAVELSIDGSGDIDIDGSSNELVVSIPGSGDVEAAELTAHVGDVSIDGSGEATVNVSDTLRAVIEGSGEITYLGDPDVEKDIDGSGEITQG